MLLHLVPQIMNRYRDIELSLIDVTIPELNLTLNAGTDLVVRKPYPNKSYHVACRKVGRKAMQGLLLELSNTIQTFTVITSWNVKAALWEKTLTHQVNYTIADTDFDVVSDDHTYLYACKDFESRWLTDFREAPPVKTQPRMDVLSCEYHKRGESVSIKDEYDDVVMVKRVEDITIPTIELERFKNRSMSGDRLPSFDDRFIVDTAKGEVAA